MVKEQRQSRFRGLKESFDYSTGRVDKLNVSTMKNLEPQVLDLTITRQSSFSEIPHDLLIDILTRYPAKSIARFRCVSKVWESILRSPDFTELFLSRSLCRPRLFFTFIEKNSSLFFFSTHQPQNQDENSSLVAVADRHKNFLAQETNGICRPVNGLVCTINPEWRDTVPMICNPSTGQSMALPRLRIGKLGENRYLGYDPVDKQYKVLSVILVMSERCYGSKEHHILTLETSGESLWREIKCSKNHYPPYDESICINGVLYYPVSVRGCEEISLIVCFDVRSEIFSFVNIPEGLEIGKYSILINYKGKLGVLHSKRGIDYDETIDGSTGFITLWVLDDHEKHIWSTNIYQLPSMWRYILQNYAYVEFVGMASTGEFVLSPYSLSTDIFYVFFYHPEKNTVVRIEIQGIEGMQGKFHTFIDYVENVMILFDRKLPTITKKKEKKRGCQLM